MNKEYRERKANIGYEWIKSSKSGTSYLCPTGSIRDKESATDAELRKVCIDESANPQND